MKPPFLLPIIVSWISCTSNVFGLSLSGAQIDEAEITHTVRVNPSGSADYTSLSDAIQFSRLGNFKVRIILEPGVYRTGELGFSDHSNLTIIEAEEAGSVILTGADIWDDWQLESENIYSKDWPYDWGYAELDSQYDIDSDLARRSEIVIYNGERLIQVDSKGSMFPESFYVDEENDKLYISPPEGGDISSDVVEVSTRNYFMFSFGKDNLVLRNLTIENYASGNQHGVPGTWTYLISGSEEDRTENLLIEGCVFRGNNNAGLSLSGLKGLTIRDSVFEDNGASGASLTRSDNVLVEDSQFNRNNWRIGGYGNYYDWGPAGIKVLLTGNGYLTGNEFNDNLATGLWLDTGIEQFRVSDNTALDNYQAGFYLEISVGPVIIENNTLLRNGLLAEKGFGTNHGGLLIAESTNAIVIGNTIEDNSHAQVLVRTRERFDEQGGYLSNTSFDGAVRDITLLYNRIKAKSYEPADPDSVYLQQVARGGLIQMTSHGLTTLYQEFFLPTLLSDYNSYYHETNSRGFSTGETFGNQIVDLNTWKNDYMHDLNSIWESESSQPESVPSGVLLDRFGLNTFIGEAAYDSAWFGSFWDLSEGWIYHANMGYLHIGQLPRFDEWLWYPGVGFVWIREGVFPYLATSQDWLYLAVFNDSSWIYNFTDRSWKQIQP